MQTSSALSRFFRDPLAHFLVAGAALFGLYALVSDEPEVRENQIIVDAAQITRLTDQFDVIVDGNTAQRLEVDVLFFVVNHRQMLHAHQIEFKHPETDAPMFFTAPMPEDMRALLGRLSDVAADRTER